MNPRHSSVLPSHRLLLSIVAVVVIGGGACVTGADDATTIPGDLCDELDAGFDASQQPVEGWDGEKMRRAAGAESEQLRDAIDSFAVVVDGMQQQFADADAPPVQLTAAQWSTDSNRISWWQHANCDSRSMSWDIHDPTLNPAGLTEAEPLTNDGGLPQLLPSEYEAVIGPDGSFQVPGDVEPKDQQTVVLFADVDRRCFALGRYVAAALGDSNNPGADVEHLAVAVDAGTRKSCLFEEDTNSSERQVRWTADYDGWRVQVVESDAGTPSVTSNERAWDLTDDLYVVATPPGT